MAKGAIQINRSYEPTLTAMMCEKISFYQDYCYRHQFDEYAITELEEVLEMFQEVKGMTYEEYKKAIEEMKANDTTATLEKCPF